MRGGRGGREGQSEPCEAAVPGTFPVVSHE